MQIVPAMPAEIERLPVRPGVTQRPAKRSQSTADDGVLTEAKLRAMFAAMRGGFGR